MYALFLVKSGEGVPYYLCWVVTMHWAPQFLMPCWCHWRWS